MDSIATIGLAAHAGRVRLRALAGNAEVWKVVLPAAQGGGRPVVRVAWGTGARGVGDEL